jgi:hypothetical protein
LTSSLQKLTSNGHTHNKHFQTVDENSNILNSSLEKLNQINTKDGLYLLSETRNPDEYDHHMMPNSCIIKIEPPSDDSTNELIDGDSIEQITFDDIDSNLNSSLTIRATQLDAIVEDSNEENSDDLEETTQPVR